MKERGMIFNTEMVKAILENRKIQTRRPVKPSVKGCTVGAYTSESGNEPVNVQEDGDPWIDIKCPFGIIGDVLYVRETFNPFAEESTDKEIPINAHIDYKADFTDQDLKEIHDMYGDEIPKFNWTPSIHMPKKYARIFLEITNIRVERVNDISEKDALKEGIISNEIYTDNAGSEGLFNCPDCDGMQVHGCFGENYGVSECDCKTCDTQKKRFSLLWKSIYGSDNQWVWVIEFKRNK
jgi:hypothetical protein